MNGTNRSIPNVQHSPVVPGNLYGWVKDANGCVVASPTSTIVYPQLTASAAVTKTLDCTSTPNATITTTITEVEHYLIIPKQ
jgi:hypothetical protein